MNTSHTEGLHAITEVLLRLGEVNTKCVDQVFNAMMRAGLDVNHWHQKNDELEEENNLPEWTI